MSKHFKKVNNQQELIDLLNNTAKLNNELKEKINRNRYSDFYTPENPYIEQLKKTSTKNIEQLKEISTKNNQELLEALKVDVLDPKNPKNKVKISIADLLKPIYDKYSGKTETLAEKINKEGINLQTESPEEIERKLEEEEKSFYDDYTPESTPQREPGRQKPEYDIYDDDDFQE